MAHIRHLLNGMSLNSKWWSKSKSKVLAWLARNTSSLLGVNASFLLGSSWWVNVEKAARIGSELGIVVLLARLSSKEFLGQYQLLLSMLTILSVMTLMGFNGPLLRALARGYDGTLRKVERATWWFSGFGAVALLMSGIIAIFLKQGIVGRALLITALFFPFYNVFKRWDIVLQSKEKYKERAIYYLFIAVTLLIVIYTLANREAVNSTDIFIAYLLVNTLYGLIFYSISRKHLVNDKIETGWMESGFKLYVADLFNVAYAHVDKIALGVVLGTEAVAIYSVASKVGEAVKLVIGNIVSVYIPKMYKAGSETVLLVIKRMRWRILGGMIFILLVLWVGAPWIVGLLFSSKYESSIVYLRWYNFVIPFHFIASIWGQLLIRERQELVFTGATMIAGIVNILLYVLLIPVLGIMGAVIASVFYYIVLAYMYWRGLKKFRSGLENVSS